ncbi:MAG: ice-binding family protein [Sphaerochaeta sp.]|nr:ice-binding family protein [Sphaerochaeta sp.]
MKQTKKVRSSLAILAIIAIALIFVGCEAEIIVPEVNSTSPANGSISAEVDGSITATFNVAMDPASLTNSTFTVSKGGVDINGSVTYDVANKKAVFSPSTILTYSQVYSATLTTGVKTLENVAMTGNKVWSFTTKPAGIGPTPVLLRTSGKYVILAKSAISTVPSSVITGDVGISPAAESYMTGFSQTDATGYATSPQVTGFLYAADMASPTNTNLTTAVEDMILAYSDAAGRITPDHTNVHVGALVGQTLLPGLYKWTTDVTIIGSDVTISGGSNDTWIFQIDQNLTIEGSLKVLLSGGAQAKNIVWQVAGTVTMGTSSHFEGIVLCLTDIIMDTGSSMNGRLQAQTQIALDQATVTQPAH